MFTLASLSKKRKPKGRFFTPIPGFVLKTSLRRPWIPTSATPSIGNGSGTGGGGNEKIKVVESAAVGTKVFINVCGHECVSPPIDQARSVRQHELEFV